jgi:hypothetical protein
MTGASQVSAGAQTPRWTGATLRVMSIPFTAEQRYACASGSFAMRTLFAIAWPVLALGLSAASAAAGAATIYRWTDEQGKTHYTEVVPPQHRKTAKPLSPPATDPSAAQQRDAQERAARLKSQATEAQRAAPAPEAAAPMASAASAPAAKRPRQVPDAQTDCQTWARLYQESLDCFGPYRTARGAMREEAFAHCTPVLAPPSRCRQVLKETE